MITIRQEKTSDYSKVFNLIKEVFEYEEYNEEKELFLLDNLRKSDSFIPELSLVAEENDLIIGHILLAKIKINKELESFDSLALAPMFVLPKKRGQGVAAELIKFAHQKAVKLNYKSVVLFGHENFYNKFGYVEAKNFDISFPFNAPSKNSMAIELVKDGLKGVSGMVKYPKEFE